MISMPEVIRITDAATSFSTASGEPSPQSPHSESRLSEPDLGTIASIDLGTNTDPRLPRPQPPTPIPAPPIPRPSIVDILSDMFNNVRREKQTDTLTLVPFAGDLTPGEPLTLVRPRMQSGPNYPPAPPTKPKGR